MNKKTEKSDELKQTAMDELKLVQDIISKQEDFTFKVFSWTVGIITAFTLGFFHTSIDISAYLYISIGLVITVIFFIVAKKHWATFYNALLRSEQIELEMKSGYGGIKINQTLKKEKAPKIISKEFLSKYYRFYLPYIALSLIVLLSGASKIFPENVDNKSKTTTQASSLVNSEKDAWAVVQKFINIQSCASYYGFSRQAKDIGENWLLVVKDKNPNTSASCSPIKILVNKKSGKIRKQ